MKKLAALFLIFGFIACNANATLISVSEQADITSSGQLFSFEFNSLIDNNGAAGTIIFSASGDFENNSANENVDVSLGSFGSFLINSTGLINNSVAGLSLSGFANGTTVKYYDTYFEAVFDVSASLLSSLVTTGTLNVDIQNGAGVNDFFNTGYAGTDPDFVSFNLSYDSISPQPSPVSESSVLIMMLLSIGIMFFIRRH